jgi:tripartite-type tricarboxylate transporter receptor subunit TctC
VPNVLEVNPALPFKTVDDVITYAKANPGKLNMASAGVGTSTHLAGELFMLMTGVTFTHVPYRGNGPAVTDLIGGQVDLMFDTLPSSLEHIKSGKIRAIAVTSTVPSNALPDVPTIGESLPGYESSAFFGLGTSRGTPDAVIARLNAEMNAILQDPKAAARLADLGGAILPGSSEEFGRLIAAETEKWAGVIRRSGAKVN